MISPPIHDTEATVAGVSDVRVLESTDDDIGGLPNESPHIPISNVPYMISSLFVSLGFAILSAVFVLKKKGIL